MRLRRREKVTSDAAAPAEGAVVGSVRCGACGAGNGAADAFCSACGAALPHERDEGSAEAATVILMPPPAETTAESFPVVPSTAPASGVGRWRRYALAVALVAAIAGVVVFGLLWHSARGHANRLQHSLDATRASLAQTKASLAATTAQLRSTTALAERRRAVLVQAQDVLAKVDPLLSSVDAVQGQSGQLQSDGETISGDADSLVSALATAANYLANTSPAYIDIPYYNSLIGTANDYFYALKAAEGLFASAESSYRGASATFGNRADAFSSSVLRLQRQLKGAVSTK